MQTLHPEIPAMLALPAYLLQYASPLIGGAALGGIVLGIIGSIAGLSLGVGTMVARDMLEPLLKIRATIFLPKSVSTKTLLRFTSPLHFLQIRLELFPVQDLDLLSLNSEYPLILQGTQLP